MNEPSNEEDASLLNAARLTSSASQCARKELSRSALSHINSLSLRSLCDYLSRRRFRGGDRLKIGRRPRNHRCD